MIPRDLNFELRVPRSRVWPDDRRGVVQWLDENDIDLDQLDQLLRHGRDVWLRIETATYEEIRVLITQARGEYVAKLVGYTEVDRPELLEESGVPLQALEDDAFLETLPVTVKVEGDLTFLSLDRILEEIRGFREYQQRRVSEHWVDAAARWKAWQRR